MINDVDVNVPADIILYGGDTAVIFVGESMLHSCSGVIEEYKINHVKIWLSANKELVLRGEKPYTAVFGIQEK